MISNSGGMVFVQLTPELAEFLIENCDSNLEMALKLLDSLGSLDLGRESLERIVALNEKFKAIKEAALKALR